MASCPNKNHPDYIRLENSRGTSVAYALWNKYEGEIPESEYSDNIVNYTLKLVETLSNPSSKVQQEINKFNKGSITIDQFISNASIPKEQGSLLKEVEGKTIEEKLSSVAANYSYTIEINTARQRGTYSPTEGYLDNDEQNTTHYSNLTVPGGTNYTENEISTPLITPSIKGHAQFATDKGIGWFRSDEQSKIEKSGDIRAGVNYLGETITFDTGKEVGSKTRRILEVQSDLFQKGRDIKDLAKGEIGFEDEGSPVEYPADERENQFLQLLNKDNNWVTFFVKSIIQDSAKKGYEKVLFPTAKTIEKIESFDKITEKLEEFKIQKERLENLKLKDVDFSVLKREPTEQDLEEYKFQNLLNIEQEEQHYLSAQKDTLSTIGFYENTVTNILKKQGFSPKVITDEYGNTWNEVTLDSPQVKKSTSTIALSKNTQVDSKLSVDALKSFWSALNLEPKAVDYLLDREGRINPEATAETRIESLGDKIIATVSYVKEHGNFETLAEEAAHVYTGLLGFEHPLYKSMYNKIATMPEYEYTKKTYPELKKEEEIRFEAIGQAIKNHMINIQEESTNDTFMNSWWKSVVRYLNNLFKSVLKDPFKKSAYEILEGNINELKGFNAVKPEEISIKPGVQELFDSNPELTNKAYEALGFEVPTTKLQGRKLEYDELDNPVLTYFDIVQELTSNERENLPSSILIKKLLNENYLPKINETDIVLGVTEGGIWRPNLKKIEAAGNNKSTLSKKIGHELLHSVTGNIILSYQSLKGDFDFTDKYALDQIRQGYIKPVKLNKIQIESLDNLVRLRNKVIDYIKENKETLERKNRGFGNYDYFINTNYTESETDLHEFISEVFTNPELINILKEIPTEGKKSNLFKDFVDAIAKILGFTNTSILEDIIAYSEEAFFQQPQITPQQKQQALEVYSQYLNTIFPDSKVKDIVYHGSKVKIDAYKKGLDNGIHFGSLEAAKEIKGGLENIQAVLLNINKIKETEDVGSPDKWNSEILTAKRNNENGIHYRNIIEDIGSDSYVVFEPEQTHILGSKQDIDGFKNFVNNNIIVANAKTPSRLEAQDEVKEYYTKNAKYYRQERYQKKKEQVNSKAVNKSQLSKIKERSDAIDAIADNLTKYYPEAELWNMEQKLTFAELVYSGKIELNCSM